MTSNEYGPDKPCRRLNCVATEPAPTGDGAAHLGGAHLDPRDRAHYDGLTTTFVAMPYAVKDAVKPIMLHHGAFGDIPRDETDTPREALEVALDAAFREINRLGQQVAHVQVDADHKIRDASRRALDCTDHGRLITELEQQVAHYAEAEARTERARLALLSEHQAIRDFVDRYTPTDQHTTNIVNALRTLNTKAANAHQRAQKG